MNLEAILDCQNLVKLIPNLTISKGNYKRAYDQVGIFIHFFATTNKDPTPHPATRTCYTIPVKTLDEFYIIVEDLETDQVR